MPARGPHDEFDSAAETLRAGYAEFNRDQDVEAIGRKYIAPDIEYVTRDGTFNGPDRLLSELGVQQENWRVETDIEEILDAGEGALVMLTKISRIERDSGKVVWKAWPAVVVRVKDGRLAFFEGYVDSRKALADYGLERG